MSFNYNMPSSSYFNNYDNNSYYQHDDRGSSSRKWVKKKNLRETVKMADQQADAIVRTVKNERFIPYVRGKNNNGPNVNTNSQSFSTFNKRLREEAQFWYLVCVLKGNRNLHKELFDTIQTYLDPIPFTPLDVKADGGDLLFYVDNVKTATQLKNSAFKIRMSDGWKLNIRVRQDIPKIEITDELKMRMKNAMISRYDAASNCLDLTKFHTDPLFVRENAFVPLNQPNVLLTAIQIVGAEIPNLKTLILTSNKIFSPEQFSSIKRFLPNLKKLCITKNGISSIGFLRCLQGMTLEELEINTNPVCDRYNDKMSYVRDVRNMFPKLTVLDGVTLPTQVKFDLEERVEFPVSQQTYFCEAGGKDLIMKFLKVYYGIYDNQNGREQIADAYSETAHFSLSLFSSQKGTNMDRYIHYSRNLIHVANLERKKRLLYTNRKDILNVLQCLPKTKHYPASFTADLIACTNSMLCICVTGMFTEAETQSQDEINHRKSPHKYFHRLFILAPSDNTVGCIIVNDQMQLTTPTRKQIQSIETNNFENAASSIATAAAEIGSLSLGGMSNMSMSDSMQTNVQVLPPNGQMQPANVQIQSTIVQMQPANVQMPVAQPHDDTKRAMVRSLAAQTGMNFIWTQKCLEESKWDFTTAMQSFSQHLGKIPQEAFVKEE